jgi:hypothetical protein
MAKVSIPIDSPTGIVERVASYAEWGPIIAGAATAAAISLVLLTFGSAIGLSAASPWPDAGLPWWAIALIGALWVLLVQVGSYALGGYLAGRLRAPIGEIATAERQFRDGAHGFIVWAVGVIVTAAVVGWTAGAALQTGVEAASNVAGGASAGVADVLTDEVDPFGYNIDRLLRTSPGTTSPTTGTEQDGAARREEVGRILRLAVEDDQLAADDRTYLAALVSERSGLPQAEAEARVDEAFASVQEAEAEVREAADDARTAAAIAAFLTAAALLVSAAAAAAGAGLGGRHRDENGTLRVFGRERFW